ncbi:MAG: hypothetical protein V1495_01210 [Pseudomonadota bacterium]
MKSVVSEETFPAAWCSELISSARGIPEPKQRVVKILTVLAAKDAESIATFLRHISDPQCQRNPSVKRTHLDLVRCRTEFFRLGYDRLAEVYAVAIERTWEDVAALLRSSPALRSVGETLPEGFAKRLGRLTLGRRKQLGRDPRRKNIELLVFDADPAVIRELLNNPRITERDVVRIAARHQAPPAVLDEVCRSDRWITQYSIKKALVFNPRTPAAFAVGLLNHLREEDLRLILSGGTSRQNLIAAARKRLGE